MDTDVELSKGEGCETSPGCSGYSSMVHSKKVIKHALRQQAKRRRKNTTIAAGNSRTLPRIVVKPLPPPPPNDPPSPVNNAQHINAATEEPAATMREVLASLPGFSLKSGRRRSTKRLSATAQLEAGLVDLESPASILASTSLRALLNRHTFQGLPPLYQRKLAQLLPAVDRQDAATSGLNNEFFARACLEWRKRLAEGEFTPENQQRLKMEAERDKNKLDPWKVKHFEPIWGEKREPKLRSGLHCINESRSSGAVTRSSLRLRLESNADAPVSESIPCPIIMAEEKVEEESCKSEATMNRSDEQYEAGMQQGLHLEEEEEEQQQQQQQPQLTEKHETGQLEESEMNSVESLPEAEMQPVEEKVCQEENQDPEEEQTEMPCQPEAANSYQEEVRLAATENNLNTAVEEHILEVSEDAVIMEETSVNPSEQSPTPAEAVPQLPECQQQQQQQQSPEEQIPRISKAQISRIPEDQIYQISDCETTTILESSPSHDNAVRPPEIVMEDSSLITNGGQTEASQVTPVAQVGHENPADGESQIPEGMEIDSETLQRIHELEVRGEMREAYEEISGCPEEIIYPILDGIEMGAGSTEEPEGQVVVAGQPEAAREQQDVGNEVAGNEDEALRDANNYVCSEMLECSWSVDPSAVNNISNNTNSTAANSRSQEELQVPWPLVAAALDGSVAANITVTTQDECGEASAVATTTTTTTDAASSGGPQFVNQETSGTVEPVNCIQLPAVVQGTAAFQPDALIGPQAIMKNFQSQSPPIITFPQLQSIRFVQTSFHHADQPSPLNNGSPGVAAAQLQPQNSVGQVSVMRTQEELVQVNAQGNNLARPPGVVRTASVQQAQAQTQAQNPVPLGVQGQGRQIVIQHQASAPPARQVVASIQQQQQQQQYSGSRSSRSGGQGQRGSRSGNKEQGGRSRTTTKEPPGAVNLERSYQICQAVIQSSPNRDQLKAHLKPPPSLLARGDGAFTTSKSGGRTITTVKSQKPGGQTVQHATATKQPPSNKSQPVMLRHVFATARQATSAEVPESSSSSSNSSSSNGVGQQQQQQQQQLASTGTGTTGSGQTTGGLGQYILVQRTGVGDGAPRASSAPPLPPQIAGIGLGVGVHLVRGRPASAGEGSHQAVTLKPRGADGRGGGGAEPSAPGLIIGGDPPPPCECNMRGAMVICRQCGAFCHDDCIGPQRICGTCLIR